MPHIVRVFRRYLTDEDSAGFIRSVARQYSEDTLQRLAATGRRSTRRAAVMSLGFIGSYRSNRTLGQALHDRDRTVRLLAENGIRAVWTRAAGEDMDRRLGIVSWLTFSRRFEEAVDKATHVIRLVPSFSEAWNHRAIAYYGLGEFAESIEDCHTTLQINPYHFLAESGMGNCYLRLEDSNSALKCFRRALKLNPGLEGVRTQIARLQRASG